MIVGRRRAGDGVALGAADDGEAVALEAEVDRHARRRQRRRHDLDADQRRRSAAAFRAAEVAASVSVSVPPPRRRPCVAPPIEADDRVAPPPGVDHVGRRRAGDRVALGAAGDREAVALGAEVDGHAGRRQRRRHGLDTDQRVVAPPRSGPPRSPRASACRVPPRRRPCPRRRSRRWCRAPLPGVDRCRPPHEPVIVSPWALPVIVKPSLWSAEVDGHRRPRPAPPTRSRP